MITFLIVIIALWLVQILIAYIYAIINRDKYGKWMFLVIMLMVTFPIFYIFYEISQRRENKVYWEDQKKEEEN